MTNELTLFINDIDPSEIRPAHMESLIRLSKEKGINFIDSKEFQFLANHLIYEYFKRSNGSSKHTVRMLKMCWNIFVDWCKTNNESSLPTKASVLEKFFNEKASDYHRNTLASFSWAIGKYHKITGCPNPCDDEFLKKTLDSIVKQKVTENELINQAPPFNGDHLDKLISLYGNKRSLLVKRNLCLLNIAYESMLRSAEITRIQIKHIEWQDDGSAVLTIPITKTNVSGEPDMAYLTPECVELIREYLSYFSCWTNEDYLFRQLSRHGTVMALPKDECGNEIRKPLTPKAIEGVFCWAWNALYPKEKGNKKDRFQTHSARVGAAQDLMKSGFSIPQIQQVGRWSSTTMVNRYCRGIKAKESVMGQMRSARKA